ncbi:MAG TPA: hypothetical protein VFL17_19065 [Anaerolineae bacterium]|nr:hypothetical protein [Anaerolineae bacterium]
MQEDDVLIARPLALTDQIDQSGHGFRRINGIEQQAFLCGD